MLGTITSAIAVAWMLMIAAVVLASIALAKFVLTVVAWRRSEKTGGAWFRLPAAVVYLLTWCSGVVVGGIAFVLVRAVDPVHPRAAMFLFVLAQVATLAWAPIVWMDMARRIASLVAPAVLHVADDDRAGRHDDRDSV